MSIDRDARLIIRLRCRRMRNGRCGMSDRSIRLPNGTTARTSTANHERAALKYGPAVLHAIELARHVDATMRKLGRAYEIELSVDETRSRRRLPNIS